jgi:phosphoribosylformylglycinamidine (FGAM) synthase-like amidotransferase family enzyme
MNEYLDFKLNSGVMKINPNASFDEITVVLEKANKLTYKFDKRRAYSLLAFNANVDVRLFRRIKDDLQEACRE